PPKPTAHWLCISAARCGWPPAVRREDPSASRPAALPREREAVVGRGCDGLDGHVRRRVGSPVCRGVGDHPRGPDPQRPAAPAEGGASDQPARVPRSRITEGAMPSLREEGAMPSGGARIKSGPARDPHSGRTERAGITYTRLPAEGYTGKAPKFPLPEPTAREHQVWRELWTTPQAAAWAKEKWRHRD